MSGIRPGRQWSWEPDPIRDDTPEVRMEYIKKWIAFFQQTDKWLRDESPYWDDESPYAKGKFEE